MKENQPSQKRLCRLYGKQKEEKDFTEITLTMIGKVIIRYMGCKSCDVVIHKASILTREKILQKARELNPGPGAGKRIVVA